MLTVNPVKLNNIKTITFGESNSNKANKDLGILVLQNPNARINFENDSNREKNIYTIQTGNKLAAKLLRTYNILFSPNCDRKAIARAEVMYMA